MAIPVTANRSAHARRDKHHTTRARSAGGLVAILASAHRTERAALYRALGLSPRYEKEAPTGEERVHLRLELFVAGARLSRQVQRIEPA